MKPSPAFPLALALVFVAALAGCLTEPFTTTEAEQPMQAFEATYQSGLWTLQARLDGGTATWRDESVHDSWLLSLAIQDANGPQLQATYALASDFSTMGFRWHCLNGIPGDPSQCPLDALDWFSTGAPAPLGIGLATQPDRPSWDIGAHHLDAAQHIHWETEGEAMVNFTDLQGMPFSQLLGQITFDESLAPTSLPLIRGPQPFGPEGIGPWTRTAFTPLGALPAADAPITPWEPSPLGSTATLVPDEEKRFGNTTLSYVEAWNRLTETAPEAADYAANGCLVGAWVWQGQGWGSGPGAGPVTPFDFTSDTYYFYVQGQEGLKAWSLSARNHSVEPLGEHAVDSWEESRSADCAEALRADAWSMSWVDAVQRAGEFEGWNLGMWLYTDWATGAPAWATGYGQARLDVYYEMAGVEGSTAYMPAGQGFSPTDGGKLWARVPPRVAQEMIPDGL